MRRHFPKPLLPGMTLGLIAPASPVYEPERRDAAVALLEELGFSVVRGASVDALDGCFSGSDAVRAGDVMRMFLDPAVDGIVCLRGGWGCARLLPLLDYAAIARHPKALVGFSDVTALQMALWAKCSLPSFYGPMPGLPARVGLRDPAARAQWLAMLSGRGPRGLQNPDGSPFRARGTTRVTGRLLGGNLSVLCQLLGTPYWPDIQPGDLLLLEDVNERPDRVDALATQLAAQEVLSRIGGLVLGDFPRIDTIASPKDLSLRRIVAEHCPQALPILWNVHAGHGRDRITLPLGTRMTIDPAAATLTLAEQPFARACPSPHIVIE